MSADLPILASALGAMPVFPLRGVVLFPGALLPLHVFEPRYRAMLDDCLATHRCMAMAYELDVPPGGGEAAPPIARVAGVGIIVQHAGLPDGRSNIVLEGRLRVALEELPFVPPYRQARASVLEEVATPVSGAERMGLLSAAATFARTAGKTDFELPPDIAAGVAADLCAHYLVVEPLARQHALEELDVAQRVRFVTAMLAEQVARGWREAGGRPD